ncbi:MAG: enoyl-CoA hydratase/isomerase family protein [Candidatus Competibacter denitrificans]
MYQTIEIQHAGAMAVLWMNRPEVHNVFNAQVIAELTSACQALDVDEMVRVVILAGRGKSFSAGADLNWMQAAGEASVEENREDAYRLAVMLRTLAQMRKPTIARVQGAAMGGGLGLVSACDMAIAASNAVFATSEVRLGLAPATISPYVIRAIGERQAYRYFQTAERISADRALQIGLVHEVVDLVELDGCIAALARALLQGGPQAQAASKALIRGVAHQPISDTLLNDTAQCIADLRATAEGREGLAAFLEKRSPAWVRDLEEGAPHVS